MFFCFSFWTKKKLNYEEYNNNNYSVQPKRKETKEFQRKANTAWESYSYLVKNIKLELNIQNTNKTKETNPKRCYTHQNKISSSKLDQPSNFFFSFIHSHSSYTWWSGLRPLNWMTGENIDAQKISKLRSRYWACTWPILFILFPLKRANTIPSMKKKLIHCPPVWNTFSMRFQRNCNKVNFEPIDRIFHISVLNECESLNACVRCLIT